MTMSKGQSISLFVINGFLIAAGITTLGLVIRMSVLYNEMLAGITNYQSSTPFGATWFCIAIGYIIIPVLGFIAAGTKNRSVLSVYIVFTVLALIAEGILLIVGFVVLGYAGILGMSCIYDSFTCSCVTSEFDYSTCVLMAKFIYLAKGVIAMWVVGYILTLAGSIASCVACCGRQQETPGVIVMPNYQPGGGIVYQTGQQNMMAPMPGTVYAGQVNPGHQPPQYKTAY